MHDLYADQALFYDLSPPYAHRHDVPFYLDYAADADGPILELGCGTGRILIPIADQGLHIVGLDSSAAMLEICRKKLAHQPHTGRSPVRLLLADMAHFSFRRQFALIIVPFRAFQHLLSSDQQLSCLRCVRDHLAPGGRFILDIFDPNYRMLTGPFPSQWVTDFDVTSGDGTRLIRRSRTLDHDKYRQIQHCQFAFQLHHADGSIQKNRVQFPMRCIFRPEASHLLARAGLVVEHLFGDYDRRPYQPDRDLIFVCRHADDPLSKR